MSTYSNLPVVIVWIIAIHVMISIYTYQFQPTFKVGKTIRFETPLHLVIVMLLLAKYAELYSMTILHRELLTPDDVRILPYVAVGCLIIQLAVALKRVSIVNTVMVAACMCNVAFLYYISIQTF